MNPREIYKKLDDFKKIESFPIPLQFYYLMVVLPIMPIIWLCIFITDQFNAPEWLCSILMAVYLFCLFGFLFGSTHQGTDEYVGSGCVGYSGYSAGDC